MKTRQASSNGIRAYAIVPSILAFHCLRRGVIITSISGGGIIAARNNQRLAAALKAGIAAAARASARSK